MVQPRSRWTALGNERGPTLLCETPGLWIDPLGTARYCGGDLAADVRFRPRRHLARDGYAVLSHLFVCPLLGFHLHDVDLFAMVSVQMGVGAFVEKNIKRLPGDWPRGLDQLSLPPVPSRQALAILDRVAFRDVLHGDCHGPVGRRLAGGL